MKSALAYFMAANYEYEQNRGAAALRYMKHAVSLAPDQPVLHTWYSVLLRDAEQYPEAIAQGERAAELAPRSAVPLRILGMAYYDAGRVSDAVNAWNRAQQIEPDDQVASYLDKAGREARVEEKFAERESSHFRLRYEGRQTGVAFRADLLRTLERQFADLSRDLGFAPQQTIIVILYTEEQFFDVTRAPAWASGLNDGKLRIPVKDLAAVDAKLERVLKHELTHSFILSLAGTRCPGWLHEGLAQMEEPRSTAEFAPQLAALFTKGEAAPLGALERSFGQLTPQQAAVAYTESLAVTEYLRDRYGMRVVLSLLHSIAEGEPPESALQQVTGLNYARLESDVAAQLAKR
jgi:peptidase MA superfamily protein